LRCSFARFISRGSGRYLMQTARVRPTGITILAILEAIVAAFLVLGGLVLAVLGPFISEFIPRPVPGLITGIFISLFGVVILILGIVGFVVVWGLWTGQGWAWAVALVLAIISIIIDLFRLPGSLLGIVINIAIVWYLWQPHVKAFYGRAGVQPPYPSRATPAPPPPSPPTPGTVIYCTKCGTANPPESRFCRNCGTEIKAP